MPFDRTTSHGHSGSISLANQSIGLPVTDFNLDAALHRLGGDRELLAALIEIFLEDGPPLLARVKSAYLAPDRSALHHAAHNLRGLASNFDAREVTEPALRLEQLAASSGRIDPAAEVALEELELAVGKWTAALRQFRP